MDFSPYHRFAECGRLERKVAQCYREGSILDEPYREHARYHHTVLHKLRSARYSLDKLRDTLSTTPVDVAVDPASDFHFEVNRLVDSYFYSCGSALDVFAREVLVIFGEQLPDKVYFRKAYEVLQQSRPGDAFLSRIEIPTWKSEFSDYRNTLTHELILAPTFTVLVDNSCGSPTAVIVFPLPDDPRAAPHERSYRRNCDVVDYLDNNLKRVLRLINAAYLDLRGRISAAGDRMPI